MRKGKGKMTLEIKTGKELYKSYAHAEDNKELDVLWDKRWVSFKSLGKILKEELIRLQKKADQPNNIEENISLAGSILTIKKLLEALK